MPRAPVRWPAAAALPALQLPKKKKSKKPSVVTGTPASTVAPAQTQTQTAPSTSAPSTPAPSNSAPSTPPPSNNDPIKVGGGDD